MANLRVLLNGDDWRLTDLIPSEWAWLRLDSPETDLDALTPAVPPWRKATVPGDVQSDLIDAGEIVEPWKDLKSREAEWTSERDWLYWLRRATPQQGDWRKAVLRFEGVDYACHVYLNGQHIGDHEGTFVPFEFDVSDVLKHRDHLDLAVLVEHAPAEPDVQGQIGWTSKVRLWKPRFAYKWDWCTRLIPLGIWDDVLLHLWRDWRITDLRVRTRLFGPMPNCTKGRVTVDVDLESEGTASGNLTVQVISPTGEVVAEASADAARDQLGRTMLRIPLTVSHPLLWWPNGEGEQPLYTVRVEIASDDVLESRETRFGFRRIRAVPNEGAPDDARPYTLEVNGRKVFLKGWNWAPVSQLYGRPHEERYRHASRLARDAHCNLLRVWGGGLQERELFYNLCDEAGILVWQEFPHSSSGVDNEPSHDPAYVRYCRQQAQVLVKRRANHPSLVIWCGGNELMDDQRKPCDVNHPVLGALEKVVAREDSTWVYLPTSPSGPVFDAAPANVGRMHDVHGHWLWLGDPDHYTFYNAIDPLLHSEFGCEGAANLRALERFLSAEYRWPPDRTNPAWVHHGSWWLNRVKVEKMFGPIDDLRTFVFASQWLQYEGLRYIAEANRRRKWRTSGCLPWQFNESWPNTSCTNCLGYFGDLRPAYWAMKAAYAPLFVSLRYERLTYQPGECLRADLWLEGAYGLGRGSTDHYAVEWSLWWLERCQVIGSGSWSGTTPEGSPQNLGTVECALPAEPGTFGLVLSARQKGGAWFQAGQDKRYIFTTHPEPAYEPLMRVPHVSAQVERPERDLLRVRCPARAPAPLVFVRADGLADHRGPYLSWGFAPFLLPGEEVVIHADGEGPIHVWALNWPGMEVVV